MHILKRFQYFAKIVPMWSYFTTHLYAEGFGVLRLVAALLGIDWSMPEEWTLLVKDFVCTDL